MALIAYKRLPVITTRDIESLLSINNVYSHCNFCRESENDSYCSISITDEAIKELEEEIEFENAKLWRTSSTTYRDRLTMDLILSKALKEIFPEDNEVLIWISW